uniref:SWIM-type domain-containing protein n=1 Tax=Lactuca sativa TaxID=4236 RepID=A0A9R1X3R9_LACSA|nr:hypothetical protein LSAT_V11C700381740 [Lactuca sativa]
MKFNTNLFYEREYCIMGCLDDFLATIGEGVIIGSAKGGGWRDMHNTMDLEFQESNEPLQTYATYVDADEQLQRYASYFDVDVNLGHDGDESNDEGIMGKIFDTPHDAYTFYNQYSFLHGFGIRIHWAYKNKTINEAYRKMYVCNKEGFKRLKANSSCGYAKKRRRNLRTGCKAMLRISKGKDGKWFVDMFNDTHNHELSITPTKVMKHRSHGKSHRSLACKSLMVELGQSGLKPSQIKKVVNAMKAPFDIDVTSKQCVDVLSEKRRQYKVSKSTEEIKYWVGQVNVDKAHWRFVSYRFMNQVDVICSCVKFETYGILCKHSLYVMKKRNVQTLPDHYILPRWTLDARFRVGARSVGLKDMNTETEVSALTLWYVRSNCTKAIEHAKNTPSKIKKFNNLVINPNGPQNASQDSCMRTFQVDMVPQISIRDPIVLTNTKGRPKNASKIKSSLEVEKKKRTCSHCKGLGHYTTSCPSKKAEEALQDK